MIWDKFILPTPTESDETETTKRLTPPCTVEVEPVGRWYEVYCRRRQQNLTLSEASYDASSSEGEDEDLEDVEEDNGLLKALDPKDWKNQDHYAVLGLGKLRYKATADQIKRAYKKKVLLHHPDKRRARGEPVKEGEEDYFTCITRAWETLGVPAKKRSFDSVDPEFDDSIPDKDDGKSDFYGVFGEAFERNARWSTDKRVPSLGNENTPFEDVNNFYLFWFDFESWREFSYLDEEEKEKGENRDERRWIEKQNKAERQKRKKEEIVRIRTLVDNAYAMDPRIKKHQEDLKLAKQREKEAKKEAARKRAAEEERIKQEALDEERKVKEKAEEEAKAQAAAVKKEKDALKKQMKKERKTLRTVAKDCDYFSPDDEAKRVQNMADVDRLAELLSLASLKELNKDLASGDKDKAAEAFNKQVEELNAKVEQEKKEVMEMSQKPSAGAGSGGGGSKVKGNWTDEEVAMLIKAVNLFPAGTNQRWDAVANFISQHCTTASNRTAKEVLAKAKQLQSNDSKLKEEANKMAFDKFAKDMKGAASIEKAEAAGLSERYVSVAEAQMMETGFNPAPWTPDEQKLLEQGLKTFPASVEDRWEKISAALPNRSKKDCMKRYKELVELIKAKKLAQIEAQKKAKKP